MLAKPQYFSPPNEVCCWRGAVKTGQAPRWSCWPGQGLARRRGGAAGQGQCWPGQVLARAGAGQGAAAERHLEDDGRGAVAKRLAGRRGEAPSGSNCGRKCQCGSIGKRLLARPMWKSKAASAEEQRRPVRPADGKYFRADCQRADGKRLVRRLPPAGIRIRRRSLPES